MRLTKPMLETIRRALMKYSTLVEKSEEEEEFTAKAWEWVDDELERRGRVRASRQAGARSPADGGPLAR